jgi:hypothetical protein
MGKSSVRRSIIAVILLADLGDGAEVARSVSFSVSDCATYAIP